MTWQNNPPVRPWYPPPAPRLNNRGIQGGTFTLDQADDQWKSVLKLESHYPDDPSAAGNDHFRTIYVQRNDCGFLSAGGGELPTIRLGVLLRFRFGIGNGQMKSFYDLCSNGIVHAAVTGESVEVDAATVQIHYAEDEFPPLCDEEPIPIRANVPPTITIGVVQNQSLAMNQIQTPKRMISVATHGDATSTFIAVPPGAQSVEIVGDPATVTAGQIFTADASLPIPFPINQEVPILAGVWEIAVSSAGGSQIAAIVFGLGV
jgi:hypothetical protein